MKAADALKATFTALVHAMKTDTRFSVAERADLTAIDVVLDAGNPTSRTQDLEVVNLLKKFTCQNANYTG